MKWYLTASLWSDATIISILTISLFVMFILLRLRVDITGIVTLTVFWISALTRLIGSFQLETQGMNGLGAVILIISL